MEHRLPVLLGSLAAISLVAVLLAWPTSGRELTVMRTDATEASGAGLPAPSDAAEVASTVLVRSPLDLPTLTVVDAVDRRPLTNATLTVLSEGRPDNNATATLTTSPKAMTDQGGVALLGGLGLADATVLVRAAGHIPKAFAGDWQVSSIVELERAASLAITVLDPWGRPVPDTRCALAMGPRHALGLDDLPADGIGHPLSKNPLWLATSDPTGGVLFDELPPARYFLTVIHDQFFTLTELGANSPIDVQTAVTLTVSLQEPFGVAFACASKSPVRSVAWGVDISKLDRSPWVQSRIGILRQKFAARMSSSLVYLHLPVRADSPCEVRCSVVLEDGTAWHGSWPMRPIQEVLEPVFLEPMAGDFRTLTIRIRDASGNELRDMPLSVRRHGDNFKVRASSGEPFHVPVGDYSLMPVGVPPPQSVFAAIKDTKLSITAASPQEHVIQLAAKVTEVIVRPKLPSSESLGPLSLFLLLADGHKLMRVNWRPEHGPIRFVVDQDRFAVRVDSVPYELVELPEQVIPATASKPIEIDINMVEKSVR